MGLVIWTIEVWYIYKCKPYKYLMWYFVFSRSSFCYAGIKLIPLYPSKCLSLENICFSSLIMFIQAKSNNHLAICGLGRSPNRWLSSLFYIWKWLDYWTVNTMCILWVESSGEELLMDGLVGMKKSINRLELYAKWHVCLCMSAFFWEMCPYFLPDSQRFYNTAKDYPFYSIYKLLAFVDLLYF